jgi:hypothetical protein
MQCSTLPEGKYYVTLGDVQDYSAAVQRTSATAIRLKHFGGKLWKTEIFASAPLIQHNYVFLNNKSAVLIQ